MNEELSASVQCFEFEWMQPFIRKRFQTLTFKGLVGLKHSDFHRFFSLKIKGAICTNYVSYLF